jgi:hypothetical protein
MGQLTPSFVNEFMVRFSYKDRRLAKIIAKIPVRFAKFIVKSRSILGIAKRKIIYYSNQRRNKRCV